MGKIIRKVAAVVMAFMVVTGSTLSIRTAALADDGMAETAPAETAAIVVPETASAQETDVAENGSAGETETQADFSETEQTAAPEETAATETEITEPTLTLGNNEYLMSLDAALGTRLCLAVDDNIKNAVKDFNISVGFTYYDAGGNETPEQPGQVDGIQAGSLFGEGRELSGDLQSVDRSAVAFVKIAVYGDELETTFYTFCGEAPVMDGNTLTFAVAKRDFQTGEVWEHDGYTYAMLDSGGQIGSDGVLGLVGEFDVIGFTRVYTGASVNGNILTDYLEYGCGFGLDGASGKASYIRSWNVADTVVAAQGGDGAIAVGKDVRVAFGKDGFYLDGVKAEGITTVWQDTEGNEYADIGALKDDIVLLQENLASFPSSGASIQPGSIEVCSPLDGMAVLNLTDSELSSYGNGTLVVNGLSPSDKGTLVINIRVSSGSLTLPGLSCDGADISGKVIWNILNSDGAPFSGSVSSPSVSAGTVLAACAAFSVEAGWNGVVAADTVDILGGINGTGFTGVLGISAKTEIAGREWTDTDCFEYELSADIGTPMPEGSEEDGQAKKTVTATYTDRTPNFGMIHYGNDDIGNTYVYTLKERPVNAEGLEHPDAVCMIEAAVSGSDGNISITWRYSWDNGGTWTDGLPEGNIFVFTDAVPSAETETTAESVTEPTAEAVSEPVTEVPTEAVTEPVTEEQTEAVTELPTETITEPLTEPVTEPVTADAPDTEVPVVDPTSLATESAAETIVGPATETPTETVTEVVAPAEAAAEASTVPDDEPAAEPATESAVGPYTEAATVVIVLQQPEIESQAAQEETAQATEEPLQETVAQTAAEATTEVTTEQTTEAPTVQTTEALAETATEMVTEASSETTTVTETVTETATETEAVKKGTLTVTMNLFDVSGSTLPSHQVFYMGIFNDAAHTQLSGYVQDSIVRIDMDGCTKASAAQEVDLDEYGYRVLYIAETDANGLPVSEGFSYRSVIKNSVAQFTPEKLSVETVVTNQEKTKETSAETEASADMAQETEGAAVPQTETEMEPAGNNGVVYGLLVALLGLTAAAAIALAISLLLQRRYK